MQTERVTFLTTPDHKAALDAFAAGAGKSVGHVLREASSAYLAQGPADDDDEAIALVLDELEQALPQMQQDLDAMRASIAEARAAIADALKPPPTSDRNLAV